MREIAAGEFSPAHDSSNKNSPRHPEESSQMHVSRVMNRVAIRHFLKLPFLFATFWFGDLKTLWIILVIMFALNAIQKFAFANLLKRDSIDLKLGDRPEGNGKVANSRPSGKRSRVILRVSLQLGLLALWIYSWKHLIS